jgi:GT2 family glycosyltransferase
MPGSAPTASIVVPTRDRPGYLDVALASIAPQARAAGAEVIVVDDGSGEAARVDDIAATHGARCERLPAPRGLNAARNAGAAAARADLIVLVDDDVEAPPGWLDALLAGAAAAPEHEVLGGPIRPRFEGPALRLCGREPPPVTALDLGPQDRDAEMVWGANLALRRSALERLGPFPEGETGAGDEEEWLRRHRAAGGRVRYVAAAGLDHRRAGRDARLPGLAQAAFRRGRTARRYDERRGRTPDPAAELRVVAGCAWHAVRRRCANGVVMGAHAAGRLAEALDPAPVGGPDFLSGRSGTVTGRRALLAGAADVALDAREVLTGRRGRLRRAARELPPRRRVLVVGVARPEHRALAEAARAELARSRHEVELAVGAPHDGRGKFQNLNALLAGRAVGPYDWMLVLDDDVELPRGFLDLLLFCAERFELRLAQPAHRRRSHAAWGVTRRQPDTVVRETSFVEIGPVTAFHRETFDDLLPFPDLRMGWGLDLHWAAVARERGWRMGVVDAVSIAHRARPAAVAYDRERAEAEAREFLAARPYVPRREAERTLAVHRTW